MTTPPPPIPPSRPMRRPSASPPVLTSSSPLSASLPSSSSPAHSSPPPPTSPLPPVDASTPARTQTASTTPLPLGRPPPGRFPASETPSLREKPVGGSMINLRSPGSPSPSPPSPSFARPRPPPPPPSAAAAPKTDEVVVDSSAVQSDVAASTPPQSSPATIMTTAPPGLSIQIDATPPSPTPTTTAPHSTERQSPARALLRQNRRSRSLLALKDAVIQAQQELDASQSSQSSTFELPHGLNPSSSSSSSSSTSSSSLSPRSLQPGASSDSLQIPARPMRRPGGSFVQNPPCPPPLQVRKGSQAALLARKNIVSTIPEERRLIIHELVMSELKYVQDLELTRTLFLEPIRKNKLLELMDFMMLFSNIEIIEQTSRELLATLTNLVNASEDVLTLCIGDIFLSQIEGLLPVYTPYCLNQAQSVETYDRLMAKKGPFAEFVKQLMMDPRAQGLPMMSYLIKPVQRLCKYPLLIRELLGKTNNSHPDRKPLENALLQTNSLVVQVNESKRSAENLRKLLQIDRLVEKRNNLKIVTPGRWFIKEGKLVKVTHKRHQERQFFLFSDMLMWAKLMPMKNNFEFKGFVFLNRSALSDVATKGVEHGFHLTRSDTQKRYLMYAKDAKEKKEWCVALLTAIQESWMTEAEATTSSPNISSSSTTTTNTTSSSSSFSTPTPFISSTPSLLSSNSTTTSSSSTSSSSSSSTTSNPTAGASTAFTIQQSSPLSPEDVLTMVDVENRIVGFTNTSQTRKLIREGSASIKGKNRHIFLFNDILIVTTKKSAKIYNKKLQINLAALIVKKKSPDTLEWIRPKPPLLEVQFTSANALQEWVTDLSPLVAALDEREPAEVNESSSSASPSTSSTADTFPSSGTGTIGRVNPYATIRGVSMAQIGFSYMI